MRRDRAARGGAELFLFERVFDDCLERLALVSRGFGRALLIGCPDPQWPARLSRFAATVDVRDPGELFAAAASGEAIIEDEWQAPAGIYDLVLSIGTLDTINQLPLALRLIRQSMGPGALLLGAIAGGETLPQLRRAMRAADSEAGGASAHIHPRIEAAALSPLLSQAGFVEPVVDVDRVQASYRSLGALVRDLRSMGATNLLNERSRRMSRAAFAAAERSFAGAADDDRTVETFEILHFACWTPNQR